VTPVAEIPLRGWGLFVPSHAMNSYIIPSSVSKVRVRASQKNSFGLMPGKEGTCPGATYGRGGCMECVGNNVRPTCYVHKAFRNAKVKEILEHNTKVLKEATRSEMTRMLVYEFNRFEVEEANAKSPSFNYRLHWAGDVFSMAYAEALAYAIGKAPKTQFWIYTRSFDFVEPLVGVPNLNTFLSLDPCNWLDGLMVHAKYQDQGLKVTYMNKENHGDYMPCPADAGNMEIEGACSKCRMCINGNKDIWFKVK
jgi:hypothetical protein